MTSILKKWDIKSKEVKEVKDNSLESQPIKFKFNFDKPSTSALSNTISSINKDEKCDNSTDVIEKKKMLFLPRQNTSATSTLWAEKYRPIKREDVIGYEKECQKMSDWLTAYKNQDPNIPRALLLYGPPGTSKTTCANVILREFGYKILNFNASDIRTKLLVEDNIINVIESSQSSNYGIIMDEVDGMSNGKDGGMSQLTKIITNSDKDPTKPRKKIKKDNWNPPIICISNNINDNKLFDDLKKICLIIEFGVVSSLSMEKLINKICLLENIRIEKLAIDALINYSQGDYRRCINLLQTYSQKSKSIELKTISDYEDIILERGINLNYFEITRKIFFMNDMNDILNIYLSENKNLLPMLIHENYNSYISNAKCDTLEALKVCHSAISSICDGDLIEKTIYNTQGWNLQTIHGITSICIPKYYSTYYPIPTKGSIKISWTNVFMKFSLYKQNIKNIYSIYNTFFTNKVYTTNDIQTLSIYILANLLSNNENRIKFGFKLLNNYNLSINHLDKLIKMNKLSNMFKTTKTTTTIKNKLSQLYISIYGQEFQCREINDVYYNCSKKPSDDEETNNDD